MAFALTSGSWIFLGAVIFLLVAVIVGYYAKSTSDISLTPWGGDSAPGAREPDNVAGHDDSQTVADWGRGTAGRHHTHAGAAPHTDGPHEAMGDVSGGGLEPPADPEADHVLIAGDGGRDVLVFHDYTSADSVALVGGLGGVAEAVPGLRAMLRHHPSSTRPDAQAAALAAEAAAEQGKFAEMHDKLLAAKHHDDAALTAAAESVGLDLDRWNTARKGPEAAARVEQHQASAHASGVNGVPTAYVGGARLDDDQTPEALIRALGDA